MKTNRCYPLASMLLLLLPTILFAQSDSIQSRISELKSKLKSGNLQPAEQRELRKYGYEIQNRGFHLEEYRNDFAGALIHIDSALTYWRSISDTINEANLMKFRGYLLGRMKRYDEGKSDIYTALRLYGMVNNEFGKTVSNYNLSLVYEFEGNLDSALFYETKVHEFWAAQENGGRNIISNNHLVNLYRKKKEFEKALVLQKQSKKLVDTDLHWNQKMNYYYTSYLLFKDTGDQKKSSKFLNEYNKLITEVKASVGADAKSLFLED